MSFLHILENIRTPFLTTVMNLVTNLGSQLLIVGVIAYIFWCVDKKKGYGAGFAFMLSGIILQGLKITFRVERPWVKDKTLHPVESALEGATGYSFPSGHSQASSSLAVFLYSLFKNKIVRILCIALMLAVPFSRLYLGVHTPQDVIVGMLIGIISTAVCLRFSDTLYEKYIATGIVCTALSVCIFIYTYILYKNGSATMELALDCAKTAGAGFGFGTGFLIERRFINFSTESKSIFRKILRFVCGIALIGAVKVGGKMILGVGIWQAFVNYMITILALCVLYPLIFSRINKKILTK